jgi:hypothetical protein
MAGDKYSMESNFWRDSSSTWRTTTSGVNQYCILPRYTQKKVNDLLKLYKSNTKDEITGYRRQIISDCLKTILKGHKGYVFNIQQLTDVLSIIQILYTDKEIDEIVGVTVEDDIFFITLDVTTIRE